MATTDDIARRVQEADSARSARRTKAALLVGELTHERTVVLHRLGEIDQQIGDVIVEHNDVIAVEELAAFVDTSATDLEQIVSARRPNRGRRKRRTAAPSSSDSTVPDPISPQENDAP
ncbi:hypothetical protein [Lentzea sp. NPDC003310]|uniref:hypothetical protein n=1 Tax=Lentzea sp. NPDC003310 TaxID=3154447 RepID=UPI00339F36D6